MFSGMRALLSIDYITKSSVTITKDSVVQLIAAIYSTSISNYGFLDDLEHRAQLFYLAVCMRV